MNGRIDALVAAYQDGDLDAAGAAALVAALTGPQAQEVRSRLAMAGLLGQALTPDEAVVRSVAERLEAEQSATTMVCAVQRSIGRRVRPRRRLASRPWLAVAALALLAVGVAWWYSAAPIASAAPPAPQAVCVITGQSDMIVRRAGMTLPSRASMPLFMGDAVTARAASTLAWPDGSRLILAPEAGAVIHAAGVHLARGLVEARITPRPVPFTISTSHGQVAVLGTRFTVRTDIARTVCELEEGTLRLTAHQGVPCMLTAGQRAILTTGASVQVEAMAPTVSPNPSPWQALFPTEDSLADWNQQHGTWTMQEGMVRGTNPIRGGKTRLLSRRAFADLELTCRLRVSGADCAEVQVGDYNWFVTIPGAGSDWIEVTLFQRGEDLRIAAAGTVLTLHPGAGEPMRPGPLGFYVMPGGTLEIADARFRIPALP